MEYPDFGLNYRSAWQQKARTELKEKSLEETIKWTITKKLKIDAYADYYLATEQELSVIQQAQRKSNKCTFVDREPHEKNDIFNIMMQETSEEQRHDTLDVLLIFVKELGSYLEKRDEKESKSYKIEVTVPLETNYLLTIAKIRAVRFFLQKFSTIYCSSNQFIISGLTSNSQYRFDNEHINIVRATTMAMAGIIGGCDTLEIIPFDKNGSEFSNRIARNVMNILNEESYLNQVSDPASGSFFIENLTYVLIQETWRQFSATSD